MLFILTIYDFFAYLNFVMQHGHLASVSKYYLVPNQIVGVFCDVFNGAENRVGHVGIVTSLLSGYNSDVPRT